MATSSSILDKSPAAPHETVHPGSAGSWHAEARAVFVKDVRSELRTKASVGTILLFALVTLLVVSMLHVTEGLGLTQGLVDDYPELLKSDPQALILRTIPGGTLLRAQLLSSFLWIVLFFSAMAGLPRTFVKEEEMRTAAALRLAARPGAVFAGKLLFNVVLVLTVTAAVLPLFLILFTPGVADWTSFILHLLVGSIGMAGTATILGAMVARAGGKSYLMLPLAFPILLPLLVLVINGTTAALYGKGGNQLVALVSYLVAMVTLSAMLFEKVWSDA
jgi:heme exporter protein B